jgi:hypothetical protein
MMNCLRRFNMILLIVFISACDAHAPSTPEASDTDEPAGRSSIDSASLPTRTAAPSPTNTLTPTRTPTPSATPSPTLDPDLLLPDLQTLPPRSLNLQVTLQGEVLLRFSNSILNAGPGAIELLGVYDAGAEKTLVTQHIYRADNDAIKEHKAGLFIFHPGHEHWHMENFALYEVWSLTPQATFDKVVAFTDKVSYCLRDDTRSNLENIAPGPIYITCDRQLQGISAGWFDTYEFDTPGQIVDISDVPDGVYALRSMVDPANQLLEMDDANNATAVYFALEGAQLQVLDRAAALRQLRLEED